MKYQKTIDNVNSGTMTRDDLAQLERNAKEKLARGDIDAKDVLSAIVLAKPADSYVLFMGFCPDADAKNRLDIEWKAKGICRFDFPESKAQVERFNSICTGDLVVLKKNKQFGKTMTLHGHGRVKSTAHDENNIRYLVMDWSVQEEIIEVPLMGAGSTVNIKHIETVKNEMPDEFFQWSTL